MRRRLSGSNAQTWLVARRAAERQYARAINRIDALVDETGDYDLDEAWLVIKQCMYPTSVMHELEHREERRMIHKTRSEYAAQFGMTWGELEQSHKIEARETARREMAAVMQDRERGV